MSARKLPHVQSVEGGFNSNLIQQSVFDVSGMVRVQTLDTCSFPLGDAVSNTFDPTSVLLRSVSFFNEIISRVLRSSQVQGSREIWGSATHADIRHGRTHEDIVGPSTKTLLRVVPWRKLHLQSRIISTADD